MYTGKVLYLQPPNEQTTQLKSNYFAFQDIKPSILFFPH